MWSMDLRRLILAATLIGCLPSFARDRIVGRPQTLPSPRSVLWIAAHPDDEAVAAPLLSFWCKEEGARCTFLVFTRGDQGVCLESDGCSPDVATVRSAEEAAASQYFGAELILLTLPDGGGHRSSWMERSRKCQKRPRRSGGRLYPRHGS
jgi:LmbE family N-acetylglucosaminyl deacetylase